MPAHKANGIVAAVIALSLAIAATVVIGKRYFMASPLLMTAERPEAAAQKCSQIGWPYGCDWQQNTVQQPKKSLRLERRSRHPRCVDNGNC
jgi:hypothetical protein